MLYVIGHYTTADPLADIDHSGRVTIADILLVTSEYGRHCTV
jgi:hypothetical protein